MNLAKAYIIRHPELGFNPRALWRSPVEAATTTAERRNDLTVVGVEDPRFAPKPDRPQSGAKEEMPGDESAAR